MAKERFYANEVEDEAEQLLGHHPEIADANIGYVFREGLMKSGGEEIMGRATTVPDKYQALMSHLAGDTRESFDFVIEVSYEMWSNANDAQRKAYLDELLSCCQGETNDDGTYSYKTRKPTIQTFPGVIKRHGGDYSPAVHKLLNRLGVETDDDGTVSQDQSEIEELVDG